VAHALKIVRDTIGCMIAGAGLPELDGLRRRAGAFGGGQSSAIGVTGGLNPQAAAMINAMAGVSLELDEGCQFATNHFAVHVLPAALAVAEEHDSTGAEFLAAFMAGYDVAAWFGHATRLRDGVHPFGTHAIVGAAAASARLRRFDADATAAAIDMASGMALASSQTAANAGASVRNFVTGLTAHNGVLAPMLVEAGLTAEPDAFSAVFGRILGDAFDPARPGGLPGHSTYLTRNYFKVHACSRWNHAPIEATAAAMAQRLLPPSDIERVIVWTFDPATRLAWRDPVNAFAAKHSIPFNVAVRLVKGTNGREAYTAATVGDPVTRSLAERVEVREDPAYTRLVPSIRPARVEISLRDGTTVIEECRVAPGGFDRPFPDAILAEKFRSLAALGLGADQVRDCELLIAALPSLPSVRPLGAILRGARPNLS
jgi:2-methylcitrate dehydratase PrpD